MLLFLVLALLNIFGLELLLEVTLEGMGLFARLLTLLWLWWWMGWELFLLEVFKWLDDDNLWLCDGLFLFMIEVVEYPLWLDDSVHFPLKVQVLVTPDRLIVLDTNPIQFKQFHEHLWGYLFTEFELDLAVE
jgi:hypothetical protein